MGQQTQQPRHPEAPVRVPESSITGTVRELLEIDKKKEAQLEQYSTLLEQLRGENKSLKATLKPLKKYESLEADTQKYRQVWLRDPILIQKLRGRIIQLYPGRGDTSVTGDNTRKDANRLFDSVVEECIQYSLIQWHIIKRRIEDKRNANRPQA